MPLKVLINGFGRIGRLTFRFLYEDPLFEIAGINDICSIESATYLGEKAVGVCCGRDADRFSGRSTEILHSESRESST